MINNGPLTQLKSPFSIFFHAILASFFINNDEIPIVKKYFQNFDSKNIKSVELLFHIYNTVLETFCIFKSNDLLTFVKKKKKTMKNK